MPWWKGLQLHDMSRIHNERQYRKRLQCLKQQVTENDCQTPTMQQSKLIEKRQHHSQQDDIGLP